MDGSIGESWFSAGRARLYSCWKDSRVVSGSMQRRVRWVPGALTLGRTCSSVVKNDLHAYAFMK
jgi:hypothetical protein